MGLKDTIFFLFAFSAFGILACFFLMDSNPGIIPSILSYFGILILVYYPVAFSLAVIFKKKDGTFRGGAGLVIAVLANAVCTALFFTIWGLMNAPLLGNVTMILGAVMFVLLFLVIKEHVAGSSEDKSA